MAAPQSQIYKSSIFDTYFYRLYNWIALDDFARLNENKILLISDFVLDIHINDIYFNKLVLITTAHDIPHNFPH